MASQVVLAVWVLLFPVYGWALSVAFINPGKSDEAYWVTVTQAMQAAASKLGITLEVTYLERDHAKAVEVARDIAARPSQRRPDYVLLGAAKPVHILTASTTVRRIVNMTALTVADANVQR